MISLKTVYRTFVLFIFLTPCLALNQTDDTQPKGFPFKLPKKNRTVN